MKWLETLYLYLNYIYNKLDYIKLLTNLQNTYNYIDIVLLAILVLQTIVLRSFDTHIYIYSAYKYKSQE